MNSNVICEAARDLWLPFHLFASLAVVYVTIQKIRCYGELAWNLIGAGIALVVLAFANPSYWICRESGESPAPVGSSSPAPTPEPTPTAQPTPTPTPAPKPPAEPPRLPDWLPIAGFVLAGVLAAALIALAVWWLTRHVISWIRKRREQRAERKASEAQALRWRAQARDVVEAIQQQIGEDRCDPLFVLENGAFFDIKVHPSRMFFAALTAWEDNQASYTPDEAAKAAAELKVLYDAAKLNAERIGLAHLPGNRLNEGKKAQHLLNLARTTTSAGEREAAWAAAAKILLGLNLAYMPRQAVEALTAPQRPQIAAESH
mgnify:CR=1 FL=1